MENEEVDKRYYIDIVFKIYDIAIKQGMSFNECENMDILGFMDYLEYTVFRKEENTEDINW